MKTKTSPQIIVIFGASGDLTRRKLLPALFDLSQKNLLPEKWAVVGTGRTKYNDTEFRAKMKKHLEEFTKGSESSIKKFIQKLYYQPINTAEVNEYSKLKKRLEHLNEELQIGGNYIYYMATPPSLYETIIKSLGTLAMNEDSETCKRKIIVEKPFGYNLASSKQLNNSLLKVFNENQIYRIDHYLGKETVQNILVSRFANGIFEPLWNRNYIHHVEITSSEHLGVGTRGGYYEGAGALRDMLQNHLLQLVGLVAMEPPSVISATAIRNETMKVFQSFRPFTKEDIKHNIVRGQYTASHIKGQYLKGYREEEGVNKNSTTETYIAMKFFIDNWRWGGVPFYIRTGKRMPTKVTEIVIHFKNTPHHLFTDTTNVGSSNQLIIRIQPDEGILLKFGMKIPGSGFSVQNVNMDFRYADLSENNQPDAYERLLVDCMQGDATLFQRGDAVEATWNFVEPILKETENNKDFKVYGYPAGTWGPEIADNLIEGEEFKWRYPCKNLADDGIYCEL